MQRLTIGVTIYNRKMTLERMIESLFASNLEVDGLEWKIRVFDDCSDEYTEDDVRSMFPVEIDYYRHERNRGADYNMGFMYRAFIESEDDILFNCDSDLIFDREWLSALAKYLPETDGILTLFNTNNHETIECVGDISIKETIGNAGTVMKREVVEDICQGIHEKETYVAMDFNWCFTFKRQGKKLYTTTRSYVQHIGLNGFNSEFGVMDIGDGFVVNDSVNGQILGDVLCEIVSHKSMTRSEKRGFYYLFPFNRISAGSKVVIYGAGVVGQDYRKQVEMCDYCSLLLQVDKNYEKYTGVSSPDVLRDVDCDYIVIAAHFAPVREEMKADILKINPKLEDKFVDEACFMVRV